jgi:hypothetical protein
MDTSASGAGVPVHPRANDANLFSLGIGTSVNRGLIEGWRAGRASCSCRA